MSLARFQTFEKNIMNKLEWEELSHKDQIELLKKTGKRFKKKYNIAFATIYESDLEFTIKYNGKHFSCYGNPRPTALFLTWYDNDAGQWFGIEVSNSSLDFFFDTQNSSPKHNDDFEAYFHFWNYQDSNIGRTYELSTLKIAEFSQYLELFDPRSFTGITIYLFSEEAVLDDGDITRTYSAWFNKMNFPFNKWPRI